MYKSTTYVTKARIDASSASITTAAYSELVASLSSNVEVLEIYNSTGQTLVLAIGASGSEDEQFYIMPGGNGLIGVLLDQGSRISVTAESANATSGELTINFYT